MAWESLIGPGLEVLKKALKSLRNKGQFKKQKTALSTIVAELLKIDPNITKVEAEFIALEAVGVKPSPELLRARQMFDRTKGFTKKKTAKKKTAKKKAAKR